MIYLIPNNRLKKPRFFSGRRFSGGAMCGLPPFDSPVPALRDGIFSPNDEGDISSSLEGVNAAWDIFFCDVSVRPLVSLPG